MTSRLGYTVEEFWEFLIPTSSGNAIAMLQADKNISDLMYSFEPSTQQRYLDRRISMFLRENRSQTVEVNLFEYDFAYASSSFRLQQVPADDIYALPINDIDLAFTLYTVLDDQLIVQEDLQYAIGEDISMKLESLSSTESGIFIFVLIINIFMLLWFVGRELSYYRAKRVFVEAMFQIREPEIRYELGKVKEFLGRVKNLKKNEEDFKIVSRENSVIAKMKKEASKKRKVMKYTEENFSRNVFIVFGLIVLEQLALILITVSFGIQLSEIKSLIMNKVDQSINLNILYGKFNVVFTVLYEYIQGTYPTIRNRPFDEEFYKDLKSCADSSGIYNSLADGLDSDLRAKVEPVLNGDLCEVLYGGKNCPYPNTLEKIKSGLISANALIVDAASTIKSKYDSCDKSQQAVIDVLYLDLFNDLEVVCWQYSSPATQYIIDILSQQVLRTIENSRNNLRTTIIACISGFAVFLLVLWRYIWIKVDRERRMVSSMVRMIPQNIVVNNFYIKNYIYRYSKM